MSERLVCFGVYCAARVVVYPKMAKRTPWTTAEAKAVERQLGKFLFANVLPGKDDIMRCLEEEEVLKGRSWLHIKNYVRNRLTAKSRKAAAKAKKC